MIILCYIIPEWFIFNSIKFNYIFFLILIIFD